MIEFTDEELTTIYKQANNEVGKARPLTTESIFKAMRAMVEAVDAKKCAKRWNELKSTGFEE